MLQFVPLRVNPATDNSPMRLFGVIFSIQAANPAIDNSPCMRLSRVISSIQAATSGTIYVIGFSILKTHWKATCQRLRPTIDATRAIVDSYLRAFYSIKDSLLSFPFFSLHTNSPYIIFWQHSKIRQQATSEPTRSSS